MSNLNFRVRFYYFGSREVVPHLEYKIETSLDIIKWTPELEKKWKVPKEISSKFKKITNEKGETPPFKVRGTCTINVYIKGKPTAFNTWTLVKKIHINEKYIELKSIVHDLEVTIPVSKLGKSTVASKNTPTHQSDYYQVQSGDTLESIAQKFKKNVQQLMKNNDLKDSNKIRVGQKIYIGQAKKTEKISIKASDPNDFVDIIYEVRSGDTLTSLAKKFKINPKLIAMQNNIPLSNLDSLSVGTILKIKNNRTRYISEIMKQEIMYSNVKGLAITQYQPKANNVKQIFVTLSGALYFIGGALDIGIAYDENGDWMLFVSVGASGEVDPSKMPHLTNNGSMQEVNELLKDKKKLSESIKKDISVSMGSSTLNVKAKYISDLAGQGFSLTNTLNVGTYSISRVTGNDKVDDVDHRGKVIKRDVRSDGFTTGVALEAKKAKQMATGKPVSITHSVSKSYTIPIFLYDRHERLMKEKGTGIEYVD